MTKENITLQDQNRKLAGEKQRLVAYAWSLTPDRFRNMEDMIDKLERENNSFYELLEKKEILIN